MKILKTIASALMLTISMSTVVGASGVSAFADEAISEPVVCEHEYVAERVDGTCTTKGYTRYTCSLCGDNYTDDYTEVNGHKFGEIVIEPTCTHRGYTVHYCEDCGYEYADRYVPSIGHAYEAEEHSETCTENGFTVYTCKNCGDSYTVGATMQSDTTTRKRR